MKRNNYYEINFGNRIDNHLKLILNIYENSEFSKRTKILRSEEKKFIPQIKEMNACTHLPVSDINPWSNNPFQKVSRKRL